MNNFATYGFTAGAITSSRNVQYEDVWSEFSKYIQEGQIKDDPNQCIEIILTLEFILAEELDKELIVISYVEEIINVVRMLECDNDKMIIARLGFLAGCYYGITDCDEDFNRSFAACVENEQYSTVVEIMSVHYDNWCNRCV
jgi:hypothetical protein